METGALGGSREVLPDALYAEAKRVLSWSANELRALQERLREAHADDLATWNRLSDAGVSRAGSPSDVARGRHLVARLELAVRDLEQVWLFLERGGERHAVTRAGIEAAGGDQATVDLVARHVLEAQEAERARIAEELHDGPAQGLANAALAVEVLEQSLRHDPASAAMEFVALRTLLGREMERMRGFIHQLRPLLAEDADLQDALEDMAQRHATETGTPVELDFAAPQEFLDATLRSVVLRVAQEALRNVHKHADASRVWLTTRMEATNGSSPRPGWVLEVRDDGRGFVLDEVLSLDRRRHFGLRFMRERAQLIGGRLEIVSAPAVGTTIRLTLDTGEESKA